MIRALISFIWWIGFLLALPGLLILAAAQRAEENLDGRELLRRYET